MMNDLISRQAVIDALEKVSELYPWRVPGDRDSYSPYNEAWQDALNRADSEIEALSSAPQRTGRWLQIKDGIKVAQYRCSECGRTVCDDRGYDPCVDYPYCHCGARMEDTNEAD